MNNFLIVGLGNPGSEYQKTRHNIGFRILDSLLEDWDDFSVKPFSLNKKLGGELATLIAEDKYLLLKPMSFMNLSGEPTVKTKNYFDIKTDNLLLIHDDLDLPFGSVKISKNSGPGGHNGIKSIIKHLGTKEFIRIRIGILTELGEKIPSEKFVLGKFSPEEEKALSEVIPLVHKVIKSFTEKGFEVTANDFN